MKKQITLLTLFMTLVTLGSAVSVLDVTVDPDKPRHGDAVDVLTYIDGEGSDITSVEADIRENGEVIEEDVLFSLETGKEKDISYWRASDAFNVSDIDTMDFEYDINVQAIDSTGEEDTLSLIVDVEQNETELEEVDPSDGLNQVVIAGLTMRDIITFVLIIFIGYTLVRE